jgi:hypothetical protein
MARMRGERSHFGNAHAAFAADGTAFCVYPGSPGETSSIFGSCDPKTPAVTGKAPRLSRTDSTTGLNSPQDLSWPHGRSCSAPRSFDFNFLGMACQLAAPAMNFTSNSIAYIWYAVLRSSSAFELGIAAPREAAPDEFHTYVGRIDAPK